MATSREYRRELAPFWKDHSKRLYRDHVNSAKYLLTKEQRKILLGLAKKKEGTTESDFWYRIRIQAKKGLLDLELLVSIASDGQLEQIFRPFSALESLKLDVMFGARTLEDAKKLYPDIRPNYERTDLGRILIAIMNADSSQTIDKQSWRYQLAVDMVNAGLNYFATKQEFRTRLHSRLFEDVRDSIALPSVRGIIY